VTASSGAKGATTVLSYALSRLEACTEACSLVLRKGTAVQDRVSVIVPAASPSVTVAPLSDNHLPSGPHLSGTLSFAAQRSPSGLSLRVTVGKTLIADSSKLRGCPPTTCPKGTHFDFRLPKMPAAGGRATLEVHGSVASAKGDGAAKLLLTKTITLASGGDDTSLGTIKVP
jgi:hypothetical protein